MTVCQSEESKNQCDGCRRGLKLQGTIHVDHEGYPVMGCTKELYEESFLQQDLEEWESQ